MKNKTPNPQRYTTARNQSVSKSIQRMRDAHQEKEILKLMSEKGISRENAKKRLLNMSKDSVSNKSNIADKSFKTNSYSSKKAQNTTKISERSNKTKKSTDILNISHEDKSDSKPSKEISFKQFVNENYSKDQNCDLSLIKNSNKNLEEHLVDFYRGRSSKESTPQKELDIKPESLPIREGFLASEELKETSMSNASNSEEVEMLAFLKDDKNSENTLERKTSDFPDSIKR